MEIILIILIMIYGAREHSNEPEIAQLRYGIILILEENDIDVVLTGHDHMFYQKDIEERIFISAKKACSIC